MVTPSDTLLVDRSDRGKLALTGPDAKTFLHGQVTQDIEALTPGRVGYSAFLTPKGKMLGDLRVFDLGDELLLDCERAALPFPEGSEADAEVVRVERGRPRYGVDIDDSTIPQEAGINERAVSFTKGCYVGQETVARLFYRGKPNRHLRGLRLTEPAERGADILLGEKAVGRLGSTCVSPRLGPIALALVRREAEPGATVTVGGAPAEVVGLPFSLG